MGRFGTRMDNAEYIEEVAKDIKHIFSSSEGKNVLEFLGNICGQFKTTVVPGSHQLSDIAEGRRQVYLTILTFIENKPDNVSALYDMLNPK